MLTFVGLGLFDELDVSLRGAEAIRSADTVFLEVYTSVLMGASIEKRGDSTGNHPLTSYPDYRRRPSSLIIFLYLSMSTFWR